MLIRAVFFFSVPGTWSEYEARRRLGRKFEVFRDSRSINSPCNTAGRWTVTKIHRNRWRYRWQLYPRKRATGWTDRRPPDSRKRADPRNPGTFFRIPGWRSFVRGALVPSSAPFPFGTSDGSTEEDEWHPVHDQNRLCFSLGGLELMRGEGRATWIPTRNRRERGEGKRPSKSRVIGTTRLNAASKYIRA